jgi:hypothetical protein
MEGSTKTHYPILLELLALFTKVVSTSPCEAQTTPSVHRFRKEIKVCHCMLALVAIGNGDKLFESLNGKCRHLNVIAKGIVKLGRL